MTKRSPLRSGLTPALVVLACLGPAFGQAKLIDLGTSMLAPADTAGHIAPDVTSSSAMVDISKPDPILELGDFVVNAKDSSGTIVGHEPVILPSGQVEDHAVIWTKDVKGNYRSTDLNDFIPESSGWQLADATSINAQGQIAGIGVKDGATHGFLLELKGIDCASYAGPLSPAALKDVKESDDAQVIVVGAFQGKHPNKFAEQQLQAARLAGMRTGAYCFLNFASTDMASGADQAKVALAACGQEAKNLSFMAIDVEPGMKGKCSQARRVKFIGAAVKAVKAAGIQPVIYACNSPKNPVWNHLTGWNASFANLPLWTPRYDGSPSLGSDAQQPWAAFGGWNARQGKQYADQSSWEAKSLQARLGCGPIDLNVFGPTLFAVKPE